MVRQQESSFARGRLSLREPKGHRPWVGPSGRVPRERPPFGEATHKLHHRRLLYSSSQAHTPQRPCRRGGDSSLVSAPRAPAGQRRGQRGRSPCSALPTGNAQQRRGKGSLLNTPKVLPVPKLTAPSGWVRPSRELDTEEQFRAAAASTVHQGGQKSQQTSPYRVAVVPANQPARLGQAVPGCHQSRGPGLCFLHPLQAQRPGAGKIGVLRTRTEE